MQDLNLVIFPSVFGKRGRLGLVSRLLLLLICFGRLLPLFRRVAVAVVRFQIARCQFAG